MLGTLPLDCGLRFDSARPAGPPAPLSDAALAGWLNRSPTAYDGDAESVARWPWATWANPPADLCELAIWVAEPHDPAAVQGLLAYFFDGPAALGGEWSCGAVWPGPAGGQIVFMHFDGTKSRRDDLYSVISDEFPTFLRDGSPVRTTDRAGAGTRGTRKHAGLHGPRAVAWR
jgi:hypothetical protein